MQAPGVSAFLFAIVGTGASACLVLDGRPYAGGRGEALVLGAPLSSSLRAAAALAQAAGLERAEDVLADPAHAPLVDAAAAALGGVLAVLANALDPSLVVLAGGLGREPAFRQRVERACQALLAYPRTPAASSRRLTAGAGRRGDRGSARGPGRPGLGLTSCSTRPACGAT